MNNQGAGFAFDATMDFSAFTMPQQQQSFLKPNEDNTSSFFGDEGIDTSASFIDPIMFSTPQTSFDMQQSFALDNTSGSTTAWDGLTPDLNALSTFPPTPVQSFDGLYQQPTSLGKRSLQLDVQDFPQSKRHEPMADFTLFSPYTSTATTSSWPLEPQSTPASTVEVGLTDEAADMCAMWFNKYNVLPSDRHIDSLSQLTGEPADAIRSWFGRLLKQGMGTGQSDSAYKSQTGQVSQQQDQFWSDQYSTDLIQTSPTQLLLEDNTTPEAACNHDTTTVQPATTLRGSKKRCTPTDDQQLLTRDPNKIYQCTRKCGKRYGRKCDWKRNEEEGYPCKSWVCSLCVSDGVENVKPCFRKYHFVQHFRNIHPEINADEYEEASVVSTETEFPRNCGFCRHRFESRQERIDHIAEHFKQGKCMLDWNEDGSDHGSGSDNTDDDDDDRPSGDGFGGGKPSYQPPPSGPSGGSSKYYGGGSSGSSDGQQPSGGFFQFQLSHCSEGDHSSQSCANRHIKPADALHSRQHSSLDLEEPKDQSSIHGFISTQSPTQPRQYVPTTGDDKTALARNALSRSLTDDVENDPLLKGIDPILAGDGSDRRQAVNAVCEKLADGNVLAQALNGNLRSADISLAITPTPVIRSAPIQNVSSDGVRDTKSPSPLLESKVIPFLKVKAPKQRLIAKQTLQSSSTPPQSFLSMKLLGAGGFSTVDEVVHLETKLRLGRKTLKNRTQTAIEEIQKEVEVLQKLRHPHVIRFLGAYASGDKMSILVSPVADTTLALWLERSTLKKPANLSETIVRMFGCLASSVRYLHEQRPVVKHMDIKPQNILIVGGDQEFPHVVLCDFGISSSEEMSDGQSKPLTRKYIAPEVFDGFSRKQAADIWSLGCVFAEMASVPFSEDNAAWLRIRNAYGGRTGKHYWQDVPGLQLKLAEFLEHATSPREETVVRTLKSMLSSEPTERPTAASLTMIFTPAPCCLNWPNDKAIFPGPNEELGGVEMLVQQDGVDCSAQQCLHGDILEASESPLSRAKCWIDDCSHTHDACRQQASTSNKVLPTRLVDLLPDGQAASFVRVVSSASIPLPADKADYIALSHVWNQTDFTLSSEWLQDKLVELPLQTLPAEINTAISSAQSLGYRYIWVDSLCVLQDSEQDKQQECTTMASVFRNAALTMVLDQLTTDNVKSKIHAICTTENPDLSPAAGHTRRSSLPESRLPASATLPAIDFTTPGFAWDTRAWALQERLLSRRFLHLGEQMYWECNALKASETFPHGLSPLVWEKVHSMSPGGQPTPSNPNRALNGGTAIVGSGARLSDKHQHLPTASWLCDRQVTKTEGDNIGTAAPASLALKIADIEAQPARESFAEQTRPNAATVYGHNIESDIPDTTSSGAHGRGNSTRHTNHMSLAGDAPSKSVEPLMVDRNRRNETRSERNENVLDGDVVRLGNYGSEEKSFEGGKI